MVSRQDIDYNLYLVFISAKFGASFSKSSTNTTLVFGFPALVNSC